jgi:hypothetical protein
MQASRCVVEKQQEPSASARDSDQQTFERFELTAHYFLK